ncbi:hypothetical protein ACP70R_009319 [Stipagrostis hirtigluma subsp. patula]
MHPETVSTACSHGVDSQELQALMDQMLLCTHHALPNPPVSAHAGLAEPRDGDRDRDRVSGLPDALLASIVSRLPAKDAARTAVLSRRWRPIWRAAPLALVDTHLLPAGGDEIPTHIDRADSRAVAAAVSRVLAAHPGPFPCVRITCCYMDMDEDRAQVALWLQHLAVKGVQELFLINRPWPLALDKPLPPTFFCMAALTRLFLGFCKFPDTAGLPRGAAFPHLRELALFNVAIAGRDIDAVIARSPVLAVLCFRGHMRSSLRLRVVSQSLRCVQIHYSDVDSIAVVDAPRLERLTVSGNFYSCSSIKIGHAPVLRLFGLVEPGKDVLQVGSTIIKAGTPVNPRAMVPTVKILALQVRFGVRNDAKMLITILKCFPNVETLHIHSKKTTESTGRINLKFWRESGAIECIQSHITVMSFHDFRGERNELSFLKFFADSAQMLRRVVIVFAKGCFHSMAEADKVKTLFSGKNATEGCTLHVCESAFPEGGGIWDYRRGSESCPDPFAFVRSSTCVLECSV